MKHSMEVSLYPLGEVSLGSVITSFVDTLKEYDLEVTPGPMSTLVIGEPAVIFTALEKAYIKAAEKSSVVINLKISNTCPV